MKDDIIGWKEPPPVYPRKAERVANLLRRRRGDWALLDVDEGLSLMPWWMPLFNNPEFEVRFVRLDDHIFGKREVYARARPSTPAEGDLTQGIDSEPSV